MSRSEGEGVLSEKEMHLRLREATINAGGVRAFSRLNGISANAVSQMLRSQIPISERMAGLLGYERVTVFHPATPETRQDGEGS